MPDFNGALSTLPMGALYMNPNPPMPTMPGAVPFEPSLLRRLEPVQLWGQDRVTEMLNAINESAMRGVPITERIRSQEWDDHWKAYLERQMWQQMRHQGVPNINGTIYPNPNPAMPAPPIGGVRG